MLFGLEIARFVEFVKLHLVLQLLLVENVNFVWTLISLVYLIVVWICFGLIVLVEGKILLVFDLLVLVTQRVPPFLYIAVRLRCKVVVVILNVTDLVFNFRSSSDVLYVRFVHQVVLSSLRKILLSNHAAIRLRFLYID